MRLFASLLAKFGKESIKYANFPESYVKRSMEQVYHKAPKGPQYRKRIVKRRTWYFSTFRPWEQGFQLENSPGTKKRMPPVEPILHWSFFRGDRVEILVGKDKGKQGIVKQIFQERNWVIVEGLNTKLEHLGKTDEFAGLVVQKEQPLLVTTDILLVDPNDLKGTEIEWRYTEAGEMVRVSCRSGKIIPIPISDQETVDYKAPSLYNEGVKDTTAKNVAEVTFKPELKTFEMDIMEKMGIKEDRIPAKYYWY